MLRSARMLYVPDSRSYRCFADLAEHQVLGQDYSIVVVARPSRVAVIAPHGGGIERRTSEIARAIAGDQFNLYLLEGIRRSKNYAALHLTSRCFDEPRCLALVARCPYVVTIHGCKGVDARVLLGGLNADLKGELAAALASRNVTVQMSDHPFLATDPSNICNRGLTRAGVQLELTGPLRGSPTESHVVSAVRAVLARLDTAG
jgi:phage replication-related protein YjqB (UPF0714/DUF867 family)